LGPIQVYRKNQTLIPDKGDSAHSLKASMFDKYQKAGPNVLEGIMHDFESGRKLIKIAPIVDGRILNVNPVQI